MSIREAAEAVVEALDFKGEVVVSFQSYNPSNVVLRVCLQSPDLILVVRTRYVQYFSPRVKGFECARQLGYACNLYSDKAVEREWK